MRSVAARRSSRSQRWRFERRKWPVRLLPERVIGRGADLSGVGGRRVRRRPARARPRAPARDDERGFLSRRARPREHLRAHVVEPDHGLHGPRPVPHLQEVELLAGAPGEEPPGRGRSPFVPLEIADRDSGGLSWTVTYQGRKPLWKRGGSGGPSAARGARPPRAGVVALDRRHALLGLRALEPEQRARTASPRTRRSRALPLPQPVALNEDPLGRLLPDALRPGLTSDRPRRTRCATRAPWARRPEGARHRGGRATPVTWRSWRNRWRSASVREAEEVEPVLADDQAGDGG